MRMNLVKIIKNSIIVLVSIAFGIISVLWNGYFYGIATNSFYEKYSYDWEYDGKSLQYLGYIAIFIYLVCLSFIIGLNYKNKKQLLLIVVSILIGVIPTAIYIFLLY